MRWMCIVGSETSHKHRQDSKERKNGVKNIAPGKLNGEGYIAELSQGDAKARGGRRASKVHHRTMDTRVTSAPEVFYEDGVVSPSSSGEPHTSSQHRRASTK